MTRSEGVEKRRGRGFEGSSGERQRVGDRRQKSEVRRQETEDRRQETGDRRQKTEEG